MDLSEAVDYIMLILDGGHEFFKHQPRIFRNKNVYINSEFIKMINLLYELYIEIDNDEIINRIKRSIIDNEIEDFPDNEILNDFYRLFSKLTHFLLKNPTQKEIRYSKLLILDLPKSLIGIIWKYDIYTNFVLESTIPKGEDSIQCIATLPNDNIVAGYNNGVLKIFPNNIELKGHTKAITCLSVSSNGRIVSGSEDQTLKIWNSLGQLLHTRNINIPICVYTLPDNRIIYSDSHRISIWNVNNNNNYSLLTINPVISMIFLPNNLIIGKHNQGLIIFNENLIKLENLYYRGSSISLLPNNHLVIGTPDFISIYDVENNKYIGDPINHTIDINNICVISNDIIVTLGIKTLSTWNLTQRTLKFSLQVNAIISCFQLLDNGFVAIGLYNGELKIYNPETNTIDFSIQAHPSRINFISLLSDGRLVTISNRNFIKVWKF